MKKITIIMMATILFQSCSLNEKENVTEIQIPAITAPVNREFVHSANIFGLNAFQALHQEEPNSNMLISPMSISIALGMTLNGADNETYNAIRQALELSLEEDNINPWYQEVINLLENADPDVLMSVANSIWYKQGLPVYDEFIDTNQTYFNAEVAELDFADPASVDIINGWVNDATNGVIEEIIDVIPAQMVMYLINALYFKGGWRFPFDIDLTQDLPFHNYDGTETIVPMMMQEITVPYYYDNEDNLLVADLPFGDSLFSFTVFLPEDMDAFCDSLTMDKWTRYTKSLQSGEIYIQLPRFELSWEKNLNDILSSLGMDIAFSPQYADFSRIMPLNGGNLFISEVKHKTNLSVDEEGAVGAAVTSVGIGYTSAPPGIIVDKPFVLSIRENQLGTIIFLGKVMEL